MKYTEAQKSHLKKKGKLGFERGKKIVLDYEHQLFMVQYLSVKVFTNGRLVPILPKAVEPHFEYFESKMNIPETFEEFKQRTYTK